MSAYAVAPGTGLVTVLFLDASSAPGLAGSGAVARPIPCDAAAPNPFSQCPGSAVCVTNASAPWSALPSQCACPSGRWGDTCDALTAAGSRIMAVYVAVVVISGLSALFCAALLAVLVCKCRVRLQLASSTTTTAFVALACASLTLACVDATLQLASPLTVSLSGPSYPGKTAPTWAMGAAGITLSFFFVTTACLNVSIRWLRVAQLARRSGPEADLNRRGRYGTFLLAYYGVFGAAVITLMSLGRQEEALYAAVPGVLFITIMYVLGALALWRQTMEVLKPSSQSAQQSSLPQHQGEGKGGGGGGDGGDGGGGAGGGGAQLAPQWGEAGGAPEDKSKAATHRLVLVVHRIVLTAVLLSALSLGSVVCIAVRAQTYELVAPPSDTTIAGDLSGSLFWLFTALSQVVVLAYVSPSLLHRARMPRLRVALDPAPPLLLLLCQCRRRRARTHGTEPAPSAPFNTAAAAGMLAQSQIGFGGGAGDALAGGQGGGLAGRAAAAQPGAGPAFPPPLLHNNTGKFTATAPSLSDAIAARRAAAARHEAAADAASPWTDPTMPTLDLDEHTRTSFMG